jgi:hypothetical protein
VNRYIALLILVAVVAVYWLWDRPAPAFRSPEVPSPTKAEVCPAPPFVKLEPVTVRPPCEFDMTSSAAMCPANLRFFPSSDLPVIVVRTVPIPVSTPIPVPRPEVIYNVTPPSRPVWMTRTPPAPKPLPAHVAAPKQRPIKPVPQQDPISNQLP